MTPRHAPWRQWQFYAILVVAAAVRAVWAWVQTGDPHPDDIVHLLMAESILAGDDFPFLVWRAGYGGTLSNSWLLAGVFAVTGPSLLVGLAFGVCLSLLQLVVWCAIAERLQPGSGLWVSALLAVSPPSLAYIGIALDYSDALLLGSVWIWMLVRGLQRPRVGRAWAAGFGALAGYLVYLHPTTIVFLPAAVLLWRWRKPVAPAWAAGGFFVGVLPLLVANGVGQGMTWRRLAGRLLQSTMPEFQQHASVSWIIGRLWTQWTTGLLKQPETILQALGTQRGALLLNLIIVGGCIYLWWHARRAPRVARWVTATIVTANLMGSVLLGVTVRPRYLYPAYFTSTMFAGMGASLSGAAGKAAVGLIMGLRALATAQDVRPIPRMPYRDVIAFLQAQGYRHGYAFAPAVALTFLSKHQLTVAETAADPLQVYDRVVHLTAEVDQAARVFYLYRLDVPEDRDYAQRFEVVARTTDTAFAVQEFPPFRIYWHLSRPIRPRELLEARPP